MTPPPITREARDWLLEKITYYSNGAMYVGRAEIIKEIGIMPLTPADPLDAVRARFQSFTRGKHQYEIFAERDGELYGRVFYTGTRAFSYPCSWERPEGKTANAEGENTYDLLPVSPHAALIAELREQADNHDWFHQMRGLFKRAADALEKQP